MVLNLKGTERLCKILCMTQFRSAWRITFCRAAKGHALALPACISPRGSAPPRLPLQPSESEEEQEEDPLRPAFSHVEDPHSKQPPTASGSSPCPAPGRWYLAWACFNIPIGSLVLSVKMLILKLTSTPHGERQEQPHTGGQGNNTGWNTSVSLRKPSCPLCTQPTAQNAIEG